MSKNIIIAKDGEDMTFRGVDTLRTSAVGGGSVDWMPEDETQTGTIDIRANGTYKAEDRGLYAFSRATVNVPPNQVTGRGSDGNDYTVTVDDNGYLQREKVPSSIRITTTPTYTGPYGDGAIISFEGIEVTAYDADGESMAEVPFEELVFPVTVADKQSDDTGTAIYDNKSVEFSMHGGHEQYEQGAALYDTEITALGTVYFVNAYGFPTVYFTDENAYITGNQTVYHYGTVYEQLSCSIDWNASSVRTSPGGITYHHATLAGNNHAFRLSPEFMPYSEYTETLVGDILFDGDVTIEGGCQVPVQWPRPGDGRILADTFDIEVVDVSPSEN